MYQVKSPDGFDISHENITYRSLKKAREALTAFCNRYRVQGYYSQTCNNGYRRQIPVDGIADYCEIIKLNS